MLIQFTVPDIQIEVGEAEFKKGLALYQKRAVGELVEDYAGVRTIVQGTQPYVVHVSAGDFSRGDCDCYIGQLGELCKHMIAAAIAMVHTYRPSDTEPLRQALDVAVCSGEVREITEAEMADFKRKQKAALGHIKSYNGPSSKWFQYQDSLTKGSRLLLIALSTLPVCQASALLCIDTLKKLDRKILGPVDDSDGTVGNTLLQVVELLNLFFTHEPTLGNFIAKKLPKGQVFDWETGFRRSG